MVNVEDCCEILDSMRVPITASERKEGKYPYYGANGIQDYVDDYIFDDELVLLAEDGGNFGSRERPIAYRISGKCWVNNHAHVLKPKKGLDVDYLCYSLMFYKVEGIVNGATRKKLTQAAMRKMQIPFRRMEEQIHIVNNLNYVLKVKEKRERKLKLLDELVRGRFVELFTGKDYPLITIDDLSLSKGEYGAQSASTEYDPNRPRYVRITDINDDGTLNDDVVSSVNVNDDEQYKLSYGDFLFARMGATVGKTYAYRSGNQIFAGYLIRYKLNLEKILPEYLYAYTRLEEYKNWVMLSQSGAAQPGINAKKFGSLQIPVASIEEQKSFLDFVRLTDKSKFGHLSMLTTMKSAYDQQTFIYP